MSDCNTSSVHLGKGKSQNAVVWTNLEHKRLDCELQKYMCNQLTSHQCEYNSARLCLSAYCVCFSPWCGWRPPVPASCGCSWKASYLIAAGWSPGSWLRRWSHRSGPLGHMGLGLEGGKDEGDSVLIFTLPLNLIVKRPTPLVAHATDTHTHTYTHTILIKSIGCSVSLLMARKVSWYNTGMS